jgi:putative ubiquitin-RnfH superfamily antitoxin RatB of RatAB toxin-antitoxin module
MAEAGTKRCVVAYATRDHQYLWTVDLPETATIADALSMARGLAASAVEEVPWDSAPVGVYGEVRDRQDVPDDGDRIEIYRPLHSDPRERRRERVRKDRRRGS